MSHPLKQRIEQFRGRIRRLLVLHGLACLVAAGVTAVLLLGATDYLLQFQDRGLRVILSLVLLAVLGRTCYRYLYRGWVLPLDEVDLARALERRFPELAGDLASALEFLQQPEDDPTAGSVALRRAVISEATARADSIDFARAIDRRRVGRAVMAAVAVLLLAALVVTLAPASSQVAVARLAYPWGEMSWPRKNYLKLKTRVDRVARGEAFEIEVADAFGGPLPPGARVHYRMEDADGAVQQKSEPMRRVGKVFVARRENVTRPFAYRVEGGDDRSMSWIAVQVVEPPAVAALRAKVVPPSYTGLPPRTTEGDLRVLQDSAVRFEATATKPLARAELALDDGPTLPAALSEDGMTLRVPGDQAAPLVAEESVVFRLLLTDREGLVAGEQRRWKLNVDRDAPPTTTIVRPAGTRFVTPEAIVPVEITAKDDLAVARVELEAGPEGSVTDAPAPWRMSLFEGPERLDPASAKAARRAQRIDRRWDLHEFAGGALGPGMQIGYRAVATDYRGQRGVSPLGRLVVITPEELIDRLAEQQRFILAELGRALQIERTSRAQLARLAIRLDTLGTLEQADVDQLRGADLNQRQATSILIDRYAGVPAHVEGLLDDLANNRVENPDIERRMRGLLEELDRLGRGELAEIARSLTAAVKSGQIRLDEPRGAADRDTAIGAALGTAAAGQDRVIAALEQLTAELAEWDNFRRFHREVGQLLRDQQGLIETIGPLTRQTLGKELRSLPPEQVARLRTAGQDQLDLARRLDRLLHEMDRTHEHLLDREPLVAQTLADAAARGRELGTSATMRSAGERLGHNEIAQAHDLQQRAVADLEELLDVLANRPQHELARLVKKLKEAQDELDSLAGRQESLRDRMGQSNTREALGELARQQESLQAEAERLARRLERLLAQAAAEKTGTAADQMREAAESALAGRAPAARSASAEAKSTLDEARRELAQRRQEAEADLAARQLAQLEDSVKALRGRQHRAGEETRRLDDLLRVQGHLTEGQAASLHQLAREQYALQEDAERLAQSVGQAGPFSWALETAGDRMAQAAGLLGRRETGAAAQTRQRDALARLDLVLESLKPQPPEPEEKSSGGGGSGKGPSGAPSGGIPPVAQLTLLRLLQQDLNERTIAWQHEFAGKPTLSPDARQRYEQLSREQDRLADLVLQCLQAEQEEGDEP